MSWKRALALAGAVAGLVAVSPARAGDLFKLALPADTIPIHGRDQDYPRAYYRPYHRDYGYSRWPGRSDPRFVVGLDLGSVLAPYDALPAPVPAAPPVYYYTTPPYPSPIGVGVRTYSLPGGNVTYSVTRAAAGGPEPLPPPRPRDGASKRER